MRPGSPALGPCRGLAPEPTGQPGGCVLEVPPGLLGTLSRPLSSCPKPRLDPLPSPRGQNPSGITQVHDDQGD